jgi:hypothetical protein
MTEGHFLGGEIMAMISAPIMGDPKGPVNKQKYLFL